MIRLAVEQADRGVRIDAARPVKPGGEAEDLLVGGGAGQGPVRHLGSLGGK